MVHGADVAFCILRCSTCHQQVPPRNLKSNYLENNQKQGQPAYSKPPSLFPPAAVSCSSLQLQTIKSIDMAPGATEPKQNLRTRLSRLGSIRFLSTSAARHTHPSGSQTFSNWARPAHTPVYVVLGMVLVAMGIGIHTAKQQIMHSPSVQVSKKKRESIMEVEDPDQVVSSADKYINNSFFRKMAHVQDHGHVDPSRPDPFVTPRRTETLKSVGVDPKASSSG